MQTCELYDGTHVSNPNLEEWMEEAVYDECQPCTTDDMATPATTDNT